MKPFSYLLFLFFIFNPILCQSQDLGDSYIGAWKQFYPSKALSEGMRTAIFQYEDLSSEQIENWIQFNQELLQKLTTTENNKPEIDSIDALLLRVQVQSEIDRWTKLMPQKHSLRIYSKLIKNSLETILKADYLLENEKTELICKRLLAIRKLADAAKMNLTQVGEQDLEKGIEELQTTFDFLGNSLPKIFEEDQSIQRCGNYDRFLKNAKQAVREVLTVATSELQNSATESKSILGRDEYARRLGLYTDSGLTPEQLSKMALEEIDKVRQLMGEVAKTYLTAEYPHRPVPKKYGELIKVALADMERDAPLNGMDYLQFWQELSKAAVEFVEQNQIATLPKNQTLRIVHAPESAGPAARIGWVASAAPFEPNPMTTLYLPSIPDTLSEQEKTDFWASFNRPFNRMIVIHELFPGHYMQLKISRETPHPIRLLFPYGVYTEGWATFCEKVLLDKGWEADRPLTHLAHLRKRLENANRAFTSVQVHCNGWNQGQVMEFSTNRSLLAPQFAKSLWGRITNSPMQLTSYFLGGAQFTALLQSEKKRLGTAFELKLFMDTIMKVGAIPIEEFYDIFATIAPN